MFYDSLSLKKFHQRSFILYNSLNQFTNFLYAIKWLGQKAAKKIQYWTLQVSVWAIHIASLHWIIILLVNIFHIFAFIANRKPFIIQLHNFNRCHMEYNIFYKRTRKLSVRLVLIHAFSELKLTKKAAVEDKIAVTWYWISVVTPLSRRIQENRISKYCSSIYSHIDVQPPRFYLYSYHFPTSMSIKKYR